MSGDKIVKAREAAIGAVDLLDERDVVSVVIFDGNAEVLVPARSAGDKEAIRSKIRGVNPRGNTAIFDGVSLAQEELAKFKDTGRVNRLILLSDGQANVGPSSPEELGRLGAVLLKQGVSASTIGLGLDYNEDLMTRLAGKSDGNSYFVESSGDLPRIFAAELKDTLSIVAKSIRLRVEFQNGVLPTGIIGRDGRIEGQTVTLDWNQLYGGQEKFAIIRATAPAGEDGAKLQFATATAEFSDPDGDRKSRVSASGSISYAARSAAVEESVDKEVLKDVLLLENTVAVERAIELNDRGLNREAGEVLRKSNRSLSDAAAVYDMEELSVRAEEQAPLAEAASKAKLEAPVRKRAATDSFQSKNQQSSH
jgi:Ca-activated chloride channel family protein